MLDREQTRVYYLTVVARDCSATEPRATAVNLTIIVSDENDNSPQFQTSTYTVYIPDKILPGRTFNGNLIYD